MTTKKHIILLFFALFVLVCTNKTSNAICLSKNKGKEEWKVYKKERLNYSISVPSDQHSEWDTTVNGIHVSKFNYWFKEDTSNEHDDTQYELTITEYPKEQTLTDKTEIKEFFDNYVETQIKEQILEGKFKSEKYIKYDKYIGKEIIYIKDKGMGVMAVRVYCVKNIVYVLRIDAFVMDYDGGKPSIKNFFSSFKLLKD